MASTLKTQIPTLRSDDPGVSATHTKHQEKVARENYNLKKKSY